MAEHYVSVDLDDPRMGHIADVLSNKTCKKILEVLSENELSEGDISKELGVPLNTVDYNVKKLVSAGLIEPSSQFFWSVKGKRIPVYRVSNKKIVISPKSKLRGVIPTVIAVAIITSILKLTLGTPSVGKSAEDTVLYAASESASNTAAKAGEGVYQSLWNASNAWAWFFIGALTGMLIFLAWNFFRKRN